MNRTELINLIIKKKKYKSYLEIGIGTGKNFKTILCENKVGVDPDPKTNALHLTSDAFFKMNRRQFDIIFIDGLHHADQVKKDIINSWECLSDGGCLLLHDTNPDREEITHVPRDSKEWCGDVYKAIHQIDGPPKFTLKDDHGVTVIRKTGPLEWRTGEIEWEGFDLLREVILQLRSEDEVKKIIESWNR